jgi:spore coat protein CotH
VPSRIFNETAPLSPYVAAGGLLLSSLIYSCSSPTSTPGATGGTTGTQGGSPNSASGGSPNGATGGSTGSPTGGSSTGTTGGSSASTGGSTGAVTGGTTGSATGGVVGTTGGTPTGGSTQATTGGTTNTGGSATSGGAATSTGGASVGGTGGSAGAGPDLTIELYDPTKFPRFDFDLPTASVNALNAIKNADDPNQSTYVTATFTYDKGGKNEVVNNVGIRLKGVGSFQPFSKKPAFKVKFDEFVDKQRFRGLARLTLNNLYDDGSFVAERLAYDVYRAAGVPAPRANSASVYINGTFYGVYTNLEAEDKHFISRWFQKEGGNLYEKEGTRDFVTAALSEFNLETNETANDTTDLKNLISTIQAATNPSTFLADLGKNMDTAEFLKFTAVEAAVNQWDTYAYTVYYVHNFRLYDDPSTGKFSFIPWGLDLSMKPFDTNVKAYIEAFKLATDRAAPNGQVTAGIVFQRCLTSPSCKSAYKTALQEVVTVYEGLGMEAAANRYYNQIKAQVALDTRKATFNGPLTTAQFDTAFQAVVTTIRGRVAALRADLAAN